jgi:hypothetical protein
MGKKSRSGSGTHILDHISDASADPDVGSGNLFALDPGSRIEKIWIRDKHPAFFD